GRKVFFLPHFQPTSIEIFGGDDSRFHEQGGEIPGGTCGRVLGYCTQRNRCAVSSHVMDEARYWTASYPTDDCIGVALVAQQVPFKSQQPRMGRVVLVRDQAP